MGNNHPDGMAPDLYDVIDFDTTTFAREYCDATLSSGTKIQPSEWWGRDQRITEKGWPGRGTLTIGSEDRLLHAAIARLQRKE
jgi:hypothetical protein